MYVYRGGGCENRVFFRSFRGSPKSDKVLPGAGSPTSVSKTSPSQAARETRRESSSMLAGGAPGTVWDDSRCVPCGVARLGDPCGFPRCTASPQRALSEPSASPQQALSKGGVLTQCFKSPRRRPREKQESDRAPMAWMVHPSHRRLIASLFLARESVCSGREESSACTCTGGGVAKTAFFS